MTNTVRFLVLAVPVNVRSQDLGGFTEMFAPQALQRTVTNKSDLRGLWNHDPGSPLGRISAGTMSVRVDQRGLHATIDADMAISYVADLARSVERRDVTGASFAFRAIDVVWEPEDPPLRRILDAHISEASLVTFPAYLHTHVALGDTPRSHILAREDRTMRYEAVDAALEYAAPKPYERRNVALAELADAIAYWERYPGRPFELRYAAPTSYRPSLAMNRNRQRQVEASL